ncbi:SH3 domain-containing protein [Chitinophaga rhizosphaerae]|uniref:SH3 domain-containing protein n=1 Tax=Chitinophaga rhizosphaerae TaxID=1864947 RepID=UPI000F8153D9|nr:SH3 domain-containing protein [Chitinophaga rhizosphaerae]
MRTLTFLLLFCVKFVTAQQFERAIIEDPDGFTNVRAQPASSAPALYKVTASEVFECEKMTGDWWKFRSFHPGAQQLPNGTGYIHKSRVRILKDLPDSSQRLVYRNILHAYHDITRQHNQQFDTYLANGKKFTPVQDKDYKESGKRHEELHDYAYSQVLELMNAYLLRTRDSLVLLDWCQVFAEDTGSAAEYPGDAIAALFEAAPEWVIRVIRPLPKRERSIVIGQIEFGLMMDEDLPDAKRMAFEKRLKQLEAMK